MARMSQSTVRYERQWGFLKAEDADVDLGWVC